MSGTRGGIHKVNAGYTLFARIAPDRVEAARAVLAGFDAHPEDLPFARAPTTHFATVTIIPAQMYGDEELPATLMLATSFSGPAATHVGELVTIVGAGLREVLQHCEDFVAGCTDAQLAEFIVAHRHADTFYSGMQHLSREDVVRHAQLRSAIETFVDEKQAEGDFGEGVGALAIRTAIQARVRSDPALAWAEDSFAPPRGAFLALYWRTLLVMAIALPALAALVACTILNIFVVHGGALHALVVCGWLALLLIAALVLGLVGAIREAEREQTYVSGRQPDAHVRALAATQNRPVINEFVIAGPVKEGWLRPLFLRLSMWIVARLAEGIPLLRDGIHIPTVATARWVAADRGRRLIFISNYTNAAEPYVRDFIDVENGAMRINLTFGFGRGYPKTRWVVDDGALTDPNGFIYVVTENQRPTSFWYGPYRDLSIDNIRINRQIREGLFGPADEDQAKAWLHLL